MHLIPFILIALLSLALAGCGRQQDARTAKEPLESLYPPSDTSFPAQKLQDSKLPLYELKMDPKDLRALERNPESDSTHPATFIADGEIYDHAQVRFRGEWARSWPKKPLKIFFRRDKPFQGHHSLNLNSAWRDPSFVRETLAYHVYAAAGVPASNSRMVRLHVNGKFRGLYVEVEQVDKPLLRRLNLRRASLFKATSDSNQADERNLGAETAFAAHYENETDDSDGLRELQAFCQELARATNVLDFFTRRVDLEKYINYLAVTVLIQHWDCFNKNHFLVYDRRGSEKWLVLPWDLDRTFGDHWNGSFNSADLPILLGTERLPGVTGWNRLQDRLLSEPTLRAQFLERLEELLETEFTPAKLFPILDRFQSDIASEARLDRRHWAGADENVHKGIVGIKSYIERRRTYLKGELRKFRGN